MRPNNYILRKTYNLKLKTHNLKLILDTYRGQGLSKKLMDSVISHPNLQGLRRWILLTNTADWLYEKYGFTKLPNPEWYMELYNPRVYNNGNPT